jgi:hypothetical protein
MTENENRALQLATVVWDSLAADYHDGDPSKVDTKVLSGAAADYLEHAAAVISPPLLHLAYETALYAQDWLSSPTPELWGKLKKASRELEEERPKYLRVMQTLTY